VIAAYAVVLFDVTGLFPLPTESGNGYLDSPYWLGMPRDAVIVVTVMQIFAAVGLVGWVAWLDGMSDYQLERSILSTLETRIALVQIFLWSSVAWPFLTYRFMTDRANTTRAVTACVPLWIAAVAVLLMIGGTFEARAPALPTLAVMLAGNVVVLADGVGWAAVCIKSTLD
jgi:hypothetical protein